MFDGRWRAGVEKGVKPVATGFDRLGVTPDHLTAAGLILAVATAVAVGAGELRLGVVLLALAAVPDLLDGAVAKVSGRASPRGAFFDSVADRVTDALVLGGIAWHLGATEGGQIPMLAVAVLATSMLISYQRAKAESLGYTAKGGLMERAERIIALAVGLAFPVLLIPVLWLMLALTGFTAVQRFVRVWGQASAPREPSPTVQRWRAWRESMSTPTGAAWRARRERRRPSNRWRRSTTRPR